MKKLLLLSTLGVSPLFVAGHAVAATCTTSGTTVTCAGEVDGGFRASNSTSNLRVTVTDGSTVSNAADDGIRLRGEGNRVTNNGTIAGTKTIGLDGENGTDGIDGGNKLMVINNGVITATNKGIDAEDKNELYVQNNGTIYSNHKAIRNSNGLSATLRNDGLIESETHEGFESGNYALIINNGTIRGSDDAIQVGEFATIYNYGLIESVARGGDEDNPQDGIDLDSGSIVNYYGAVIRSDDDAAIDFDPSVNTSTIANHGLISGTVGILTDEADAAKQIVHNYGTIEGRNGVAVDLGQGDDELRLYNGSNLLGDALLGAGDDLLYFGSAITDLTTGLIDGGTGYNSIEFFRLNSDDIFSVSMFDETMTLSFLNDANDFTLSLTNWDIFRFNDTSFSWAQVAAMAPVPAVPLPAPALMLVSALGGMAALRRRNKR